MTAIEEMAGMDVLCSDKTGTLTLNRLTVDRNLIEVQINADCIGAFFLQELLYSTEKDYQNIQGWYMI